MAHKPTRSNARSRELGAPFHHASDQRFAGARGVRTFKQFTLLLSLVLFWNPLRSTKAWANPPHEIGELSPSVTRDMKSTVELYSETYHLAAPAISGMNSRVTVKWGSRSFFLTGTFGQDWMSEPGGKMALQPYSFLYAAPGAGLHIMLPSWLSGSASFGLRYDWRFLTRVNRDEQSDEQITPQDHRILATLGQLWHQGPSMAAHGIWFSELYGESVTSSLDNGNTTLAGFVRGGYRWRSGESTPNRKLSPLSALLRDWSQDAFIEVFASVDGSGAYYANVLELRPTLRMARSIGTTGLSLAVMGGPVQPVYLWGDGADQESSFVVPSNRQELSARFLLIIDMDAG
jgi:hypothetical protein